MKKQFSLRTLFFVVLACGLIQFLVFTLLLPLVEALSNVSRAQRERGAFPLKFNRTTIGLLVYRNKLLSDDANIRFFSAAAIAEFGGDGKPAEPDLLPLIDDPDIQVRCEAIHALGKIGASNKSIISKILNQASHQDPYVRIAVAEALGNVEAKDESIDQVLRHLSRDSDVRISSLANSSLVKVEDKLEPYLQQLLDVLLKSRISQDERDYVVFAISRICPCPVPPQPPVKAKDSTGSDDSRTRNSAPKDE